MAIEKSQSILQSNKKRESENALGFDSVFQWFLFKIGQVRVVQFFTRLNFLRALRRFFKFRWVKKVSFKSLFLRIRRFFSVESQDSEAPAEQKTPVQKTFSLKQMLALPLSQHIAMLPNSETIWHKLFVSHLESLLGQGYDKHDAGLYPLVRQHCMDDIKRWLQENAITEKDYQEMSANIQMHCEQCEAYCARQSESRDKINALSVELSKLPLTKRERVVELLRRVGQDVPSKRVVHENLMRDIRARVLLDQVGRPDAEIDVSVIPSFGYPVELMRQAAGGSQNDKSSGAPDDTFSQSPYQSSNAKKSYKSGFSNWVPALVATPNKDSSLSIDRSVDSDFSNHSHTLASAPKSRHSDSLPSQNKDKNTAGAAISDHNVDQSLIAKHHVLKPLIPPFLRELKLVIARRFTRQGQSVALHQQPDGALAIRQTAAVQAQCAVETSDVSSKDAARSGKWLNSLVPLQSQKAPQVCPVPEQSLRSAQVSVSAHSVKQNSLLYRTFSLWAHVNQLLMPKQTGQLAIVNKPFAVAPLTVRPLLQPLGSSQFASRFVHAPDIRLPVSNTTNAIKLKTSSQNFMHADKNGTTPLHGFSMFNARLRPRMGRKVAKDVNSKNEPLSMKART